MTQEEVQKLENGIYILHWKNNGGSSLAAVGRFSDGTVWLAPTNWTSGLGCGDVWKDVAAAELLLTKKPHKVHVTLVTPLTSN